MSTIKRSYYCLWVSILLINNLIISAPKITHISWGLIQIQHDDGNTISFKDAKIFPNGSESWNWSLTDLHHNPGIAKQDVLKLIYICDVLILSTGMEKVLQVQQETIDFLDSMGIEYYIAQTEQAVALYNTYVEQGKKVAGLFHSTC